jgi:very-short-patch-repair endonuclease
MWSKLRNRQLEGVKFRRQHPIGPYIVDFVSLEKQLVIEIDGGQHIENKRDKEREKYLRMKGFKVLRFWNNDVLRNIDGVLEKIRYEISPHPNPLPKGEGEI